MDTEKDNYWTKNYGKIGKECYRTCMIHYTSMVPQYSEHVLYFSCMEKCVKEKKEKKEKEKKNGWVWEW